MSVQCSELRLLSGGVVNPIWLLMTRWIVPPLS